MSNPRVSIIIPNYNGERFLTECLNTVLASSYKDFELILVDDGSTDSSLKIIQRFIKSDTRIKLIINQHNLGASASRNKAISSCLGSVVVFLDNDTRVESDWLINLVKPLLGSHPQLFSTCSKTLLYQNPKLISTAGLKLVPHTGWGLARGGRQPDQLLQWNIPVECVSISAAMAVSKSALTKVGGFDELLAVHTEDLDLCWRLWIYGYKMLYMPNSRVYHYAKSISDRAKYMSANTEFVYFHINKNTFRTLLKNYSLPYLIKYLPFAIGITLARGVIVLISRRNIFGLTSFVKSIIWNVVNLSDTLKKRQVIQSNRQISDSNLSSSIMSQDSLSYIYHHYYV